MNIIEGPLKFLSVFNWFGGLAGCVQVVRGDKMIWVERHPGVNGGRMAKMLKQHGIKVRPFSKLYHADHLGFCVPGRQEKRAIELLEANQYNVRR